MLEDAGCKYKLNFDEGGCQKQFKKSYNQKKIHVGIQYLEQMSKEERMCRKNIINGGGGIL